MDLWSRGTLVTCSACQPAEDTRERETHQCVISLIASSGLLPRQGDHERKLVTRTLQFRVRVHTLGQASSELSLVRKFLKDSRKFLGDN